MSRSKHLPKPLLLEQLLTVDPGWHSGWAYWQRGTVSATGIITLSKEHRMLTDIAYRLEAMFREFGTLCKLTKPRVVVVEGVARYQSMSAEAAVDSGDLFNLCYLIGGYVVIASVSGAKVHIITAPQWKGNMSKETTVARIKLSIDRKFPNHIADAVGIGLSMAGKL